MSDVSFPRHYIDVDIPAFLRQVIDELGSQSSPLQLESLRGVYTRGEQYEWSFLDAANIEEEWPREAGFTPRERP